MIDCTLLEQWHHLYPDPNASTKANEESRMREEEWLSTFAGLTHLNQSQVRDLVGWKFQGMPHRKARALRALERSAWDGFNGRPGTEALIRDALASSDEYEALSIMARPGRGVVYFGPAMSSVVLAACQPERYTVADSHALSTLRKHRLMQGGSSMFNLYDWLPYLEVCRRLAVQCSKTLRYIDQALYIGDNQAQFLG